MSEFVGAMRRARFAGNTAERVFRMLDKDGSGEVSLKEYSNLQPYFENLLQDLERKKEAISAAQALKASSSSSKTGASGPGKQRLGVAATLDLTAFRKGPDEGDINLWWTRKPQ